MPRRKRRGRQRQKLLAEIQLRRSNLEIRKTRKIRSKIKTRRIRRRRRRTRREMLR
jgi:hypothetical protein